MKISIITSVLNRVNDIEATLSSILGQRNVDVELVVVDGASTDGTVEVIKALADKDDRIRWSSQVDGGVYPSINIGLARTTGDIIGILHAGDHFTSPDVLATVEEAILQGAPWVYGDVRYVNREGRVTRHYSGERFSPDKLRHGFAPPHPSLYITRKTLETVGPYRENYLVGADFEYFVRLMLVHGIDGKYLPLEMVEMSTGGLSSKWRNRLWTNIREKRRAFADNNLPRPGFSLALRYLYLIKNH